MPRSRIPLPIGRLRATIYKRMRTVTSRGAPTDSDSQEIDMKNSDVSADAREELEQAAEGVYSAHAASDPSELDVIQPLEEPSETDEDLCEQCAGICFDEEKIRESMNESPPWAPNSTLVLAFDEVNKECNLCRLFLKTIEHYKLQRLSDKEYGCSHYYYHYYRLEPQKIDKVPGLVFVLKDWTRKPGWLLLGSNNAFPAQGRLYARNIQPNRVNWKILKQWLLYCESKHEKSCGAVESVDLPGFRVIDCETRTIVEAPRKCPYVTLSYVWGSGSRPSFRFRLPAKLPLLIEDAMTCTKMIGLRYLWVDRYCIDQLDVNSKHDLIQNMDRIYRCAAVTIINAAGTGPNCGLPGVSDTSRRPLVSVSLGGNRKSLKMLPNTIVDVAKSKWSTRGWTYQEGLLPRRRLVFTTSQIYFQCLEMHCCELLPVDFPVRDPDNFTKIAEVYPRRVFPCLESTRGSNSAWSIIHVYLERKLSFESDMLNAIVGILRHVCVHFWGVPIETSMLRTARTDPPTMIHPEEAFLTALMWRPGNEKLRNDISEVVISRREGFPSWSWTACEGITMFTEGTDMYGSTNLDIDVEIKDQTGCKWSISKYLKEMAENISTYRFEPCVYLTGWITYMYFRRAELFRETSAKTLAAGGPLSVHAYDKSNTHYIVYATIFTALLLNESVVRPQSPYQCAWPVLLFVGAENESVGLGGFVLKPLDGDRYERLGVLDSSRRYIKASRMKNGGRRFVISGNSTPEAILECEWRHVQLV